MTILYIIIVGGILGWLASMLSLHALRLQCALSDGRPCLENDLFCGLFPSAWCHAL